jgi:hypothetical protein
MPTISATTKSAKDGLGIKTRESTTIEIQASLIQLLIGGLTRLMEKNTHTAT